MVSVEVTTELVYSYLNSSEIYSRRYLPYFGGNKGNKNKMSTDCNEQM